MRRIIETVVLLAAAAVCGWSGGCDKPAPARPVSKPVVYVSIPAQRMVTETLDYTGYTAADKSVELRSQVMGYLRSTEFKPRDRVKAGDLLFQIDSSQFQAAVAQAEAEVAVATAQYDLAGAKLSRMEEALKANSISEVQVIEQRADRERAKAEVDKAKALLDTAKLNLAYTSITAPVNGMMSRDLVSTGDLIEPQKTLMATITDDSVIYVYFNMSELDALRLRQARRGSAETYDLRQDKPPVFVGLANEAGHSHEGYLDYFAPELDRSTGTLEVRGRFDNTHRTLLAGYFVRVRIPVSRPTRSLMVPERALGMDQGQRYLLVVNPQNKVEYRRVRLGVEENGLRVILEGLGPDERVIVNGLQRVRPGAEVTAEAVTVESAVGSTPRPATQPVATSPQAN